MRISRRTIIDAMQSKPVRDALRNRAEKILKRGNELAAENEDTQNMELWIEDGTRPKGRPFSAVKANDAEQEHGTMYREKHRILGRAAGGT